MDVPGEAVIAVLTYLFPGFITAALVFALTPEPRLIPFERVVQALIFTMIVQVSVGAVAATLRFVGHNGFIVGVWTEQVRVTWSVVLAVALGLSLAWAANGDHVHRLLRWSRVTCQTSFSSEWYGALSRNRGYVVLHLTGQRRLYGWPEEWPSNPGHGHFVVAQAEWLDEDRRIPLLGVDRILIRAEDVEMIELMAISETLQDDKNGTSQTADAAASTATDGSTADNCRQVAVLASAVQARPSSAPAWEEVKGSDV